ncbi:MAG TPA: ABC transporter ATP-binding protein [Chitinophagaceae bacterium]|nr:ABC transporter ATP-binding protein [Chitinophagaceae bacterium]
MIQVVDLYKKYPHAEHASVDSLSFSFTAGKIIGLLGPNGAGKTTTISILSGLIRDYQGQIHVLGSDTRKQAEQIRQKIGVVPQQIALYPTLSCRENLYYFGRLYQIPQASLMSIVEEHLVYFGLADHADKQVKQFSGGMKRRANIIASLLNNPELLILDEPTAGVDVQSRSMILKFLKAYNEKGNSIIYTSHLLDEAEQLCDEVLIIDHGKKVIQGSPKELIALNDCTNLETLFLKLTGNSLRDA